VVDRGSVVIGFGVALLIAGQGPVVWGYRADRKGVPFPWDRYWHWWWVCMAYGMLAAPALVLFSWLIYRGRPPQWVFGLATGLVLLVVLLMGFSHWRLWFPILGVGRPFMGNYMPRRDYIRQSLRTFGGSAALALAGCLVIFVGGRMISG
jgi:hypothetical protein